MTRELMWQGCVLALPALCDVSDPPLLILALVCLPSCSAVPGNVVDTPESPIRAKVTGLLLLVMTNMEEAGWPREWQYNDNLERSVPW